MRSIEMKMAMMARVAFRIVLANQTNTLVIIIMESTGFVSKKIKMKRPIALITKAQSCIMFYGLLIYD